MADFLDFSRIFLVKRTLLPWYNRNRRKSHLAVAKFEISRSPFLIEWRKLKAVHIPMNNKPIHKERE